MQKTETSAIRNICDVMNWAHLQLEIAVENARDRGEWSKVVHAAVNAVAERHDT